MTKGTEKSQKLVSVLIEKKETKLNERKPTSMPFLQVSQNLEKKLNY